MSDKENEIRLEHLLEEEIAVVRPRMYRVILHNDDYTTMEFVISILMGVFHKSEAEAAHIMLNVHKKGVGLAGMYTREIAETKVLRVAELATKEEYPLKCTMEPE
ncbi:MAG: ATP-dependent Clp protease adaptor ClpS [Nitrospinota bacterium]|nr:ATP-dependent Clp protease adaptor ClpS [Nitrospinota bacterium]